MIWRQLSRDLRDSDRRWTSDDMNDLNNVMIICEMLKLIMILLIFLKFRLN
jgi:hypothetical protein